MTWNYRIIKHDKGDRVSFGVHEAYYQDGRILTWTADPILDSGAETKAELIKDLEMMLADCKRRILAESKLPNDKEVEIRMSEISKGPYISWEEFNKQFNQKIKIKK